MGIGGVADWREMVGWAGHGGIKFVVSRKR